MNTPTRYHPLSVALHWLTVLLMLGAGFLSESGGNSPINIHMMLGSMLLMVMITRLIVRFITKQPAQADTGNALFNKLGEWMHYGLYLAAFFILGMGALIANKRNLFAVAMGNGSVAGRAGSLGEIHQLGWFLVILLVLGHVGAALYHQFILKDNLLNRMWFGKQ
ncbi:MAG: cytochrome b/b6 domain-containing protein [Anaerolineales bacterium]|nr:cytochrome b/b6 domain-containing protein [Anaerolineales bacterium]